MEKKHCEEERGSKEMRLAENADSCDFSELVMSEVHLGCPPRYSGSQVSRFTFRHPLGPNAGGAPCNTPVEGQSSISGQMLAFDEDGDLVLTRRNYAEVSNESAITIQHKITSSIPSVGLQVWRAALVLADFVLHTISTSSDFNNVVACELGAGTGMVGILLAQVAKTIFITDHGDEVLDNCSTNINLNSSIFKQHETSVYVRELDWKRSWPPTLRMSACESSNQRYLWLPSEITEAEGASLLLAADVIYGDDLTDALFDTLTELMSKGSKKVLYLALEKRYNFTLDDLDVVANGYSHFHSYLKDEEEVNMLGASPGCFIGKRVDLSGIPQFIQEYDRGNDLEIWQIRYVRSEQPFCAKLMWKLLK